MLKDLCGRDVKTGQAIILQDIKNMPLKVVEVHEPIVQQTPAGPVPVTRVRVLMDINLNIAGGGVVVCPFFIVQQPEESVPDNKLIC